MKLRIILTVMLLLLAPGLLVNGKPAGDSGIMDIITLKDKKVPAQDIWRHRQHDVSVYFSQINDSESAYTVLFYRTEKDTLRCYQAAYASDKELTKAGYRWLNDSLVILHLYDPEIKQSLDLKVTGYGTSRGNKTTTIGLH